MWPFGKRLRDQDAVEKYRRWLRRWLLGPGRFIVAGTVAVAILAGIVWAAVNTWDNNFAPAMGDKPGKEAVTGSPIAAPDISTDRSEDKQVKQQQLEINSNSASENARQSEGKDEEEVSLMEHDGQVPTLALPVSGKKISSYGYHYSPLYNDYRFHTGIVLQAGDDSEVYPCMPGKVVEISLMEDRGYAVTLDHGGGWASKYEGLAEVTVQKDNNLTSGDSLGRAQAGGHGQGEITFTLTRNGNPVDPAPYMQKY